MVTSRGLKGPTTPLASPDKAASSRNHSPEKGDTRTAVFVTLEGELVHKPHSYFAAQKDEALLAAAGIRGRGKGSRIGVPESIPPFSTLCRTCSELDLQYWCLPPPLVRRVPYLMAYASLGVASLYPWQAECLHLALGRRRDAPETQGKADANLSRLLFEGVRSLVVVPHVSLCAERVQHLRQLLSPLALRVEAFHAGANAASSWYVGVDVAICTLEKANLIINRLVQDCLIPQVAATEESAESAEANTLDPFGEAKDAVSRDSSERWLGWARERWESLRRRLPSVAGELPVGLVCVDEIHFIGDSQRGHLLEMLLAKLLFINQILQKPVQLLGMSATLSNVHQVSYLMHPLLHWRVSFAAGERKTLNLLRSISRWLGAQVFVTDLRPSPLDVFVKVFAWSRGEGLKAVRRLHEGSLSLPPAGDAATRAAARALMAAASASVAAAGAPGSQATQQTASGMGASNDCASLAAAALRYLRSEADSAPQGTPSFSGRGESATRVEADANGELRVGWQADAEHLGALTWEVLREGRRVIVFCPTQEWTARTAGFLAKALPFYRRAEAWADLLKQRAAIYLEPQKRVQSANPHQQQEHHQQQTPSWQHERTKQHEQQQQAFAQARRELLGLPTALLAQLLVQSPHLYVEPHVLQGREELQWQLRQLARLPPTTMLAAIQEGVAYHHAGLSGDERECVESGYRRGHLSVLCATSTLALGVNLPAARVIIRAPHVGRDEFLSPGRFHQMAGRAGRKGLENRGDAYLICSPATLPKVETLLSSVCAADVSGAAGCGGEGGDGGAVTSCLRGHRLCRFVLETVHVLLPLLLRPAQMNAAGGPSGRAFFDVAAIAMQCTLRGHQDAAAVVIEEAAECVRLLHAFYLLEAEPASTPSTSPLDGGGDGERTSECFASKDEGARQLQFVTGPVKAEEDVEAVPETPVRAANAVSVAHTPSLRSLAFPASPLPAVCKLLLQQYPCLRSPVVLARMLQGGEFDKKQHPASELSSFVNSQSPLRSPVKSAKEAASDCSSAPGSPLKDAGFIRHPSRSSAAATQEQETFSSRVRLYFRGLDVLADQLAVTSKSTLSTTGSAANHSSRGKWDDLGGRLAPTEAGAAAVEAGLAPWEAAELFADVFKTSIMGLCAATELHLIFLAAVSIGTDTQPHWRSYLSIYDGLDAPSRDVICTEAIRAQGAARRDANDNTLDLVLANKFGVTKKALITCTSQGALVCATVAAFLRSLRPQEAALSEVCFMLAGKLKLACLPMGVVASTLAMPAAPQCSVGARELNFDNSETAAALQQLLQLEGMTARRAVALRAAKIKSCAELANAPVYEVFKALEAAEPAPLVHPSASSEGSDAASMYKMHRQRARLLAVTVKLKDAAKEEQATRLQALEDEAAAHWSLLGKVSERSGEEKQIAGNKVSDL
ncbi:hypothetical protein Emed_002389 [Eimeria media]